MEERYIFSKLMKKYQVSDTENEGNLFLIAEDEIFMKLT